MGVSVSTTICIAAEECKYQFQFQYEGQWKQPFHIKRMHWVNQTIRISWNKQGTFFPRKNPTSGAWNGCGVCSSGVASQERWAVRIQEERRRGEAGDDPRTATARTGPRVPHGQRAGEPGQHGEESLGQTFSGFGHHNHHHHWLLPLSQPKSKPPRTLIITLTMTATMTTSCPSL